MADLRVGGLATGMDIESIVKDLMKAERIPLDKLKQDKQLLEWKQDDYREINKALFDFRDKVFDLKLQGTFNVKNATSSNEDAVEVSAGGNVTDGIYTLDIKQMARGVNKASASELNDEVDADGNTLALADQFNSLSGTLSFILKGWKDGAETTEDFSFDTSTDNIYDVVNEINSRDMGITASYDSKLNRFFLTTPTGQNSKIQVTSDSSNFLSYASGGSSADTVLKLDIEENIAYNGVDAEVDFGGGQFSFADNKFTINGINFTLKDEPADPASPITVNVNVTNDTDAVFNKIKDFVESYNDTIDKIYDKLQEKRYRDYSPLTEEQKEEMSEKQIELWEEKARSGLLRNDRILNEIISDMRMTMAGIVKNISGKYDSLDEIGISTQNWHENGKLYIDEDKLKAALNDDPEGINSFFTNSSEVDSEKGIAMRLYDVVVEGTELLTDKAGSESSFSLIDNSYIGKRLRDLSDEIEDWEERLIEIENRYWREFTAMEKAINQMNAQSMWLAQQFGGM